MLFKSKGPSFGACLISPASKYGLVGPVEERDICLREKYSSIGVANGEKDDKGMLEVWYDLTRYRKVLD